MARKVIDITHSPNKYDILSQTPANYSEDNYFLKELQEKVDADWEYRPNRIDIEYEKEWGKQSYSPIQVVVQSVKSEKGQVISDDIRNIVFRNIFERRFEIGSRFRFGDLPITPQDRDEEKNVWLVVNMNSVNMTSGAVIQRCNGSLGNLIVNSQGVNTYHYEPVVQSTDLSAVNFYYNETAVSPQSQLLIIAQHNEYTKKYFVNQRFIIGYDKVYRIKAINKFYSSTTFNPHHVGLIKIYMEITETSPYDDFENRIAYQIQDPLVIEQSEKQYAIKFISPEVIPSTLGTEFIDFVPQLVDENGNPISGINIDLEYELQNKPTSLDINDIILVNVSNGIYSMKRLKSYVRGDLTLTWIVKAADSPTREEITASFTLNVRN